MTLELFSCSFVPDVDRQRRYRVHTQRRWSLFRPISEHSLHVDSCCDRTSVFPC